MNKHFPLWLIYMHAAIIASSFVLIAFERLA